MTNKLRSLFSENQKVWSVYLPAGYPCIDSTVSLVKKLAECGVSLIELGIPFSDSVVDGPVIQAANTKALQNGMHMNLLFEQIREIRKSTAVQIVLMGSFNPVLQYGVERFCEVCEEVGVHGAILPDLPYEVYLETYATHFEQHGVGVCFLVTSETSPERVRQLASASSGFLYVVSAPGVTGGVLSVDEGRVNYLSRLKEMNLPAPLVVGFGVKEYEQVRAVFNYASGVIVGTEYLRWIESADDVVKATGEFVREVFQNTRSPGWLISSSNV